MATAAVLPPSDLSFSYAEKTLERWAQAELSEEEELAFLEQAIKDLGEVGNVENFRKAMEMLGERAVRIDDAFDRVKMTMDAFVRDNGANFPGIIPFQEEWHRHELEWQGLLRTSRDLATKTSSQYEVYAMYLKAFSEITTKEELMEVADMLTEFSKNKPSGIPEDFAKKFEDLRKIVGGEPGYDGFKDRFERYLDQQGGLLDAQAAALKTDIDILAAEVENLDSQVKAATLALKISPVLGLVGVAIAGTVLAVFAKKRGDKQKELNAKNEDLKKVEALQTELGKIRAQFGGVVPDFKILCTNLNVFMNTWNVFHVEAKDFADKFRLLETPTESPVLLKLRVELALKVAEPLRLGLRDYALYIN